ncbi:MAG: DMT family transporter [Candidatus Micrarchaeaceae archaeon]
MILLGVTAAITAVMFWLVSNSASKRIVRGLGTHTVTMLMIGLGTVPALVGTLVIGIYSVPASSALLSMAAGLLLPVGFALGYTTLRTEKLSNAAPLGEIQPAAFVLFGLAVLGESVSVLQMTSIIAIFSGAFLILTTEGMKFNRKLMPYILSNICWVIYWLAMTYSVRWAHTYALPILISRLTAVAPALIYFMSDKRSAIDLHWLRVKIKTNGTFAALISLATIAAFADASGDTVFGITLQTNVLALGGAMLALSPMFIAFAGFLLYHEKLTRLQLAGLAIMVIGAVALNAL